MDISGKQTNSNINAVRIVVMAFGLLCGFTGVIAGVFEILQGNNAIDSLRISTVGEAYTMWQHNTYMAFTFIPNYLLTGIITSLISLLVIIWSIFFIQKRFGGLVFILLSILQLFTGGGFVIDLALITFILSLGIDSKLEWWNRIFNNRFGQILASLWIWSIFLYAVLAVILLIITIIGMNRQDLLEILDNLAALMFIPILIMISGGIAYNVQNNIKNNAT